MGSKGSEENIGIKNVIGKLLSFWDGKFLRRYVLVSGRAYTHTYRSVCVCVCPRTVN